MDGRGIFKIPEPSNVLVNVSDFQGNMLQGWGLYNDGNVCGLVSLFLAFHRMVIVEYLIDPSLIFNDNNLPDLSSVYVDLHSESNSISEGI